MTDKKIDLARAYLNKTIGRRDFLSRTSALGISASAAGVLLNAVATQAYAASDVNFQKYKGKTIKLLLNKHPYTDAMIKNIENFKTLTGLNVTYDIFPEDVYFDKVTAALATKSSAYDAFMTGAYQTWKYGPARQLVDLNKFINDPSMTAPAYNWNDVFESLRQSTAWDGKAGSQLGGPGSKQWAVPWAFELNSITYNRKALDDMKMTPPENLDDLIDKAGKISKDGKGMYGVGVRGSRSWATIHAGFMSAYTNFGAKDFTTAGGKLTPAMNSPESKAFHKKWIEMLHVGGPKNWSNYTWYEVGNDLGAGKSAMIYDADVLGYFMDGGTNLEAGKLGFDAFKPNPAAKTATPNVWIWSLAMSEFSKMKEAAWYFIQWCTGTPNTTFGAVHADLVNPVRKSVLDNPDLHARLDKSYPGYLKQFETLIPNSRIYFTPQQLFPEFTTDWASMLQQMYANQIPVDEGLDKLAQSLTKKLRDVGL